MTTPQDAHASGSHAHAGCEFVSPVPFDYTLLSNLYIHHDGHDVIDMAGDVAHLPMHRGTSRATTTTAAAAVAAAAARDPQGTYVAMQADTVVDTAQQPRRTVSRLVRTENTVNHIWLVSQAPASVNDHDDDDDGNGDRAPAVTHETKNGALFARTFYTPSELFDYCAAHDMRFPVRHHGTDMLRRQLLPPPPPSAAAATTTARASATQQSQHQHDNDDDHHHHHYNDDCHMPTAKWIDIQCMRGDPASARLVRDVLSRFPLDDVTLDRCLCLGTHDVVDTDYLSSDAGSYIYVQLMCTPHIAHSSTTATHEPFAASPHGKAAGAGAADAAHEQPHASRVKSVMQMRFEAVRDGQPHNAVPAAVPVAVLVFAEWIVTIHEQPFSELNDLLRLVALRCGPHRAPTPHTVPRGNALAMARHNAVAPVARFTTPFVFASFMQIAVGHHLDSVTLARAVDDLGDAVFDVRRRAPQQDQMLRRITAVRRCFGECSADVNRRESVVAQLLQPQLAHNFLLQDAHTRRQLEQALAHLRHVLHELEDCRDAVAMSSWYHNIALHWTMLRSGNSALRQLLQMTEIANVVFPIFIIQTIYSMNVTLPYQYSDDPLFDSMVPFYLLAGIMAAYTLACMPAILRIFKRKRFATRLLA